MLLSQGILLLYPDQNQKLPPGRGREVTHWGPLLPTPGTTLPFLVRNQNVVRTLSKEPMSSVMAEALPSPSAQNHVGFTIQPSSRFHRPTLCRSQLNASF